MAKFVVRRLGWMTLVIFVVSLITFIFMHAVPRRAIHTGKTAAAGHTRTTKNEIWAAPLAA